MLDSGMLRSPLHAWHKARARRWSDTDGWTMPAYSREDFGDSGENDDLVLVDRSFQAKVLIQGRGVAEWVRESIGPGPANKPLGVSQLGDGGLACRLTDDQVLLLGAGPSLDLRGHGIDLFARGLDLAAPFATGRLRAINQTSKLAAFAFIGSKWEALLARLTHLDLLPVDSCAQTRVAGISALLVRTSEKSPGAVGIYVTWDLGEYFWEAVLEAGRTWKIKPGAIPLSGA